MSGPSKSHKKIYVIGGIAAAVMFAFSFALVPLYSLLCKSIGTNTSTRGGQLLTEVKGGDQSVDLTRTVTVQFLSVNHNGLPWDFYPKQKSIRVHPGESNKIVYFAKNATDKTMTVQAIPSMTPTTSISHFHKIECFCFNQQTLKGRESRDMALVFQIDKDLPKDVHVITLAYTLFDATPKEEARKG